MIKHFLKNRELIIFKQKFSLKIVTVAHHQGNMFYIITFLYFVLNLTSLRLV